MPKITNNPIGKVPGTDSRFQTFNDPRFLKVPQKDKKVKIDKRFTQFLKTNHISKPNKLDRYGRPYDTEKRANEFQKEFDELYYNETDNLVTNSTITKGESEGSTASTLPKDDSNTNSDNEVDSYVESEIEVSSSLWESTDQSIPKGNPTKQIAIMGCKWSQITAVDILILLQSFTNSSLEAGGNLVNLNTKAQGIEEVAIYPSDFGLKCMEQEKLNGPYMNNEIELDEDPGSEETIPFKIPSDGSSDDEGDIQDDTGFEQNDMKIDSFSLASNLYKSTEEEEMERQERLRQYQVKCSLYYYAVVRCSSLDIAIRLYDELDGLDTDIAINGLDLRFIPDNIQFPHAATSKANEIPVHYDIPQILGSSALQHSKVRCTWDEPDAKRTRIFTKKFTDKELEQMDIDDYIGSEDDFDEDNTINGSNGFFTVDETNLAEYRKTLLGDLLDDDEEPIINSKPISNLKINFEADLKGLTLAKEKSAENKDLKSPEEYSNITSQERLPQSKKAITHDSRELANLELLAMDIKPNRHSNLSDKIGEHNKSKNKRKVKDPKSRANDNFKMDTSDPRFSKLFSDPNFDIDPTNPQFKATPSMKNLLDLKRKKSKKNKETKISSSTEVYKEPKKCHSVDSEIQNDKPPPQDVNDIILVKKRKNKI